MNILRRFWVELAGVGVGSLVCAILWVMFGVGGCIVIPIPLLGLCLSRLEFAACLGFMVGLMGEINFRLPRLLGLPFWKAPEDLLRDITWGMGVMCMAFIPLGIILWPVVVAPVAFVCVLFVGSCGFWLLREHRRRQAALRQGFAVQPEAATGQSAVLPVSPSTSMT